MTTCFFCQNLLSDYIEGILPSSRHEELKCHLDHCMVCSSTHKDLLWTMEVLHSLPPRTMSHDLAIRIAEATQAGYRGWFSRRRWSRAALLLAMPGLLFAATVATFPNLFPWLSRFQATGDESQFVRYFPLLQGASDIIEEQANWLGLHEANMRSVWEEGGLSPEEFEKTFRTGAVRSGTAPAEEAVDDTGDEP